MAAAIVSIFFAVTLILAAFSLYASREAISVKDLRPSPLNLYSSSTTNQRVIAGHRHVSSVNNHIIESDSVLFPEWIVFVIAEGKGEGDGLDYKCLFQNSATSPATYAGTLPVSNRRSFKCTMPNSVRRRHPLRSPVLTKSELNSTELTLDWTLRSQLKRWTWLVYDSLSTASDVIVFAKGVNRPGHVRSPTSLRCVFTDDVTNQQVRTPVTSSDQEVFRCGHPHILLQGSSISLTLETLDEDQQKKQLVSSVAPSVAVYVPFQNHTGTALLQTFSSANSLSTLCACTMVHNVGKFLKEWVIYHSGIGVEKFILYDNDSDDDDKGDESLRNVVRELVDDGFTLETVYWPWPKAQEAGFSHNVILSKYSCKWMMFMDVDEFVFSPHWSNAAKPSSDMLQSMLPRLPVGQMKIQCHDFGPSNQTRHPRNGVTQGYTCRRKLEERHKSIVLLEAVDVSLQNSVHHFKIRAGDYRAEKVGMEKAVVNHYKYQAWSEFKTKFKRRVSTYVPDWTDKVNMRSKDRTPGLGVEALEPEGWAMKFCDIVDTRLQLLTKKWFGRRIPNHSGIKMAWER
ncbi:hypothetical protein QQ045_000466 [Rhodiola kirilowii]